MNNLLPDWLTGVWQRRSIETEDGCDTTTQVIWLQTHRCFGDIRIPADRPILSNRSMAKLSHSELLALAKQQGFAGVTTLQEMTCQWHRYIDYQPFNGSRDVGSLHWEGELLIECGVDAAYREEWQQLDQGGDFTALILSSQSPLTDGQQWQGCLVTSGDYFMFVRNRALPLPPADSLSLLIAAPTANQPTDLQTAYLDCEISFGVCRSGKVPWEIRLSTLPWREGQPLWSLQDLAIDLDAGEVIQTAISPTGPQANHWMIQEWGSGSIFEN